MSKLPSASTSFRTRGRPMHPSCPRGLHHAMPLLRYLSLSFGECIQRARSVLACTSIRLVFPVTLGIWISHSRDAGELFLLWLTPDQLPALCAFNLSRVQCVATLYGFG